MNKLFRVTLTAFLIAGLSGCSSTSTSTGSVSGSATEASTSATEESVKENDYFQLENVYLDTDDVPYDNSLKYLYVFYNVAPKSENLRISSSACTLQIDDNYTYTSDNILDAGKYVSNYYYSSYIKDVYGGSSLKVLTVFEVPENQIDSAAEITFLPYGVEEGNEVKFQPGDIIKSTNMETIAQAADPEGYAAYQNSYQEADEATANTVKTYLNGYQWDFYVNSTSYQLEFYAPNNFEMRVLGNANDGTYIVRNGFVSITYDSNGSTVDIPYTLTGSDIDLDVADAFDVKG